MPSDRLTFALQAYDSGDYETAEGGHVMKIRPCAIVFLPEDETLTPLEQLQRAIVLEAPEGAEVPDSIDTLWRGTAAERVRGNLRRVLRSRGFFARPALNPVSKPLDHHHQRLLERQVPVPGGSIIGVEIDGWIQHPGHGQGFFEIAQGDLGDRVAVAHVRGRDIRIMLEVIVIAAL